MRRHLPALVVVGAILSGCGSNDTTSSSDDTTLVATSTIATSTTAPLSSTVASPASEPAPAPTSSSDAQTTTTQAAGKTVPQGGRVRALMESDVNTWDGTDYYAYAWQVNFVTCNTLVGHPTTMDPVRNLEMRPDLAASYAMSDDGLSYTFELRDGVKFNDGRPVRGEDVKGTFLRLLDPDAAFQAFGTAYYDAIEGVPAYKDGTADDISGIRVDDSAVTFTLTQPNGAFLHALALGFACIVPADAPRQKANLPPPMTGPYMVTAHTQGRSLKIDRNPVWEANKAAGLPEDPDTNNVDGWDVTIGVAPDAQILQLKNDQADVSFDSTCCVSAAGSALADDPATAERFSSSPSPSLIYLTLNATLPPLDDPRVRRAINYAIDREAVVKILGGEPQGSASSGLLPDAMIPDGAPRDPYPPTPDAAAAEALLEEAGAKRPLDAGTLYYLEGGVNPDIAQQVASDLDRVGIRVRIKGLGADTFYSFIQDPANEDHMALAGFAADYPDGGAFLEPLLLSSTAKGGSNYGDFQDAALDAELARIGALPPGPERGAAYAQLAYDTAAEQAPWATLLTQNITNLTSPRYGGYFYDATKSLALGLAYLDN